jgi:hypothetical protein
VYLALLLRLAAATAHITPAPLQVAALEEAQLARREPERLEIRQAQHQHKDQTEATLYRAQPAAVAEHLLLVEAARLIKPVTAATVQRQL